MSRIGFVAQRASSSSWCWSASTASEASRAQPAAAEGRLDCVEEVLTRDLRRDTLRLDKRDTPRAERRENGLGH